RQGDDTGGQCAELDKTASIQRQIVDFLTVHDLSERGAVGFDQWGRARDFDGLADIADRHVKVDAGNLVDLNGYASAGFGSESRQLRFNTICPGRQCWYGEPPSLVGQHFA